MYTDVPIAALRAREFQLPNDRSIGGCLATNLLIARSPGFRQKERGIAERESTMLRKLLLAVSLFSMVGAPVAAQAESRHSSPVSAKENVAGVGTLGIVIALAVVVGVVLIVSHDNKKHPASP